MMRTEHENKKTIHEKNIQQSESIQVIINVNNILKLSKRTHVACISTGD